MTYSISDFRIEGRYSGMSVALRGLLVSAVPDPTEDLAIFGLRHQTPAGDSSRARTTYWAGKFEEAEPESGSSDLIRHVYLTPLRDAPKSPAPSGERSHMPPYRQHKEVVS